MAATSTGSAAVGEDRRWEPSHGDVDKAQVAALGDPELHLADVGRDGSGERIRNAQNPGSRISVSACL